MEKRTISSNGIPVVLTNDYAWEVIEEDNGKLHYQIIIGMPMLDDSCVFLTWSVDTGILSVLRYLNNSTPAVEMRMEFWKAQEIVKSILDVGELKLMPLYDARKY